MSEQEALDGDRNLYIEERLMKTLVEKTKQRKKFARDITANFEEWEQCVRRLSARVNEENGGERFCDRWVELFTPVGRVRLYGSLDVEKGHVVFERPKAE